VAISALALASVLAGCSAPLTYDTHPPQVPSAASQAPSTDGERPSTAASDDSGQPSTEPTTGCESLDLAKLRLRPDQKGPATLAYGSRIIGSAAVNAGDGYEIVAVRLAEPTGPGGQDKVAWIRRTGDVKGWLVPISEKWKGGGLPNGGVLPEGPQARAAALACLYPV